MSEEDDSEDCGLLTIATGDHSHDADDSQVRVLKLEEGSRRKIGDAWYTCDKSMTLRFTPTSPVHVFCLRKSRTKEAQSRIVAMCSAEGQISLHLIEDNIEQAKPGKSDNFEKLCAVVNALAKESPHTNVSVCVTLTPKPAPAPKVAAASKSKRAKTTETDEVDDHST
jgi:hypothetical protein